MEFERRTHIYEASATVFESILVEEIGSEDQPGLLLFPNFFGIKEWDIAKAETFAALGFKVLVVDFYGQGKRGVDVESSSKLLQELTADRALMRAQLLAHHQELVKQPGVASGPVAAAGFCLGGKCVLDLARAGADIAGVVYHGLYDAPPIPSAPMNAKLLICHGWNDPLCPPEAVAELARELTGAGVDWQLNAYSHTGHAFTADDVPMSEDQTFGYQAKSSQRSWQATIDFFDNHFS